MSHDHLFDDPLGEVDHIADLMISVEGAHLGDRDALVYRYRVQRLRRLAMRRLSAFIDAKRAREIDGGRAQIKARLPQKDFEELEAILALLDQFSHNNEADG